MKVIVNKTEIEIFEGARVKDAVTKYLVQQGQTFNSENFILRDAYGHRIGAYGSLLPDTVLFVENKTSPN